MHYAYIDITMQYPNFIASFVVNLRVLFRNATSLCGMKYLVFPQNMDSRSDRFGQRRCHIKEKAEY